MDISICFADFPTEKITETTRAYRQLGIGYASLGALLMATGTPTTPTAAGRSPPRHLLMTGTAYRRSAELARVVGPYKGYERNAKPHKRVIRKHADASEQHPLDRHDGPRDPRPAPTTTWQECIELGETNGYRNAQATLLAPTGTSGWPWMSTPLVSGPLGLVTFKKLVGGRSMQFVNQTVPRALRTLGYPEEHVEAITEYIGEHGPSWMFPA